MVKAIVHDNRESRLSPFADKENLIPTGSNVFIGFEILDVVNLALNSYQPLQYDHLSVANARRCKIPLHGSLVRNFGIASRFARNDSPDAQRQFVESESLPILHGPAGNNES